MHLFNSLCIEMEVCIKHFCVYQKTRIVLSETTCRFVQATSWKSHFPRDTVFTWKNSGSPDLGIWQTFSWKWTQAIFLCVYVWTYHLKTCAPCPSKPCQDSFLAWSLFNPKPFVLLHVKAVTELWLLLCLSALGLTFQEPGLPLLWE